MDEKTLKDLIDGLIEDKKSERRLKIISRVIIFSLFLIILILPFFSSDNIYRSGNHTAVINISGVISPGGDNTKKTIDLIKKAVNNDLCENIILNVNSPGGSATQSKIIFDQISRIKKTSDKTIYAIIDDVGASGGYYIAASGDLVIANSSSIVGSIGVRLDSINIQSLAEKLGIVSQTISSGEDKTILDPLQPLSQKQRDHLNKLVTDIHDEFIQDIKTARGNKIRDNTVFTGLFWTGKQALQLGLIDEVGSIYDINLKYLNNSNLVTYNKKPSFIEQLMQSIIPNYSSALVSVSY
tara:strand:+ start:1307 stop:2197 length:891 start_codon:yes stop_codon:yes gene_type:complete